jgi:hypothetical protein
LGSAGVADAVGLDTGSVEGVVVGLEATGKVTAAVNAGVGLGGLWVTLICGDANVRITGVPVATAADGLQADAAHT